MKYAAGASLRPRMSEFAIQVHAVNLDATLPERHLCRELLSEDEQIRAGSFAYQELRDRWTVCRAALRAILGRYLGSAPLELQFEQAEFGKPFLADNGCGNLFFNLSHSDNLAVVAVTSTAPVGVDVERVRAIPDWKRVANRFFSRSENAAMSGVNQQQRERAFYNCWTRKEAIIKATGEGLSARLDEFDVTLTPGEPAAVLHDRRSANNEQTWQLQNLDLADDFVGAVALQCPSEVNVTFYGYWKVGNA